MKTENLTVFEFAKKEVVRELAEQIENAVEKGIPWEGKTGHDALVDKVLDLSKFVIYLPPAKPRKTRKDAGIKRAKVEVSG